MFSPLEQFENHYLAKSLLSAHLGLSGGGTTLGVTAWVNTAVLLGLVWLGLSRARITPATGGVQTLVEGWWSTLTGVIRQQLDQDQRFTPLLVWTFGWIGLTNLAGMIPFGFTVTSHLSVTLFLALGFNLGFLFWGLTYHRLRFFGLFVPSGVPVVLLPLIVVIEVVSYCIRPVSLALRLFANMMAGHTLMHILVGFLTGAPVLTTLLVGVAIFAVTLFEFAIALLQAYVFVVLCCIYIRDALEPGH